MERSVSINGNLSVHEGGMFVCGDMNFASEKWKSKDLSRFKKILAMPVSENFDFSWMMLSQQEEMLLRQLHLKECKEVLGDLQKKMCALVFNHFMSLIKSKYIKYERRSWQEEKRCVNMTLNDVDVELSEMGKSKPQSVSLKELGVNPRNLIFGQAGVGKTFIVKRICKEWALGRLWKDEFDCVLHVDMPRLCKSKKPLDNVSDLLLAIIFDRDECKREVIGKFKDWIKISVTSVLWILDGYDEVEHLIEGTIFEKLRDGSFVEKQQHHVILTSRHEMSKDGYRIDCRKYRQFELRGFSASSVKKYIQLYFGEKVDAIMRTMTGWMFDAAKIPLILELICFVFDEMQGMKFCTRTELYEKMTTIQLRRSGKKSEWWKRDSERGKILKEARNALRKAAWESLFDGKELLGDEAHKFVQESGLLTSMDGLETWTWNHKTFQEYLAAEYIVGSGKDIGSRLAEIRKINAGTAFFGFICGLHWSMDEECLTKWFPKELEQYPFDLHHFEELFWVEEGGEVLRRFLKEYWKEFVAKKGNQLFFDSCEKGLFDTMKLLCEMGVDANERGGYYKTGILHEAAYGIIDINIVNWLVKEKRVCLDSLDINGSTPFHLACRGNNIQVAEILVKHGCDTRKSCDCEKTRMIALFNLGHKNCDGETPMVALVKRGHKNLLKVLLDLDVQDDGIPLAAASTGDLELIHILHDHGYDVPEMSLIPAIRSKNLQVVQKHLEERKANPNCLNYGKSYLNVAIESGSLEMVKVLINFGANDHSGDACRLAVLGNCKDILTLLVENGFRVDARDTSDKTLLHFAVEGGVLEIVQFLVAGNLGVDVNAVCSRGRTPLFYAKDWKIFVFLLEHGAVLKEIDNEGNSLLHLAACNGSCDIARGLLSLLKDASFLNLQNDDGETALMLAAKYHNGECVYRYYEFDRDDAVGTKKGEAALKILDKLTYGDRVGADFIISFLLLKKGADASIKNHLGETAIIIAITKRWWDKLPVVKLLLEDIENLENLLYHAVKSSEFELVNFFLKKGARVDGTCIGGERILNVATRKGNLEMVKLLLENGARVNVRSSGGETPLMRARSAEIVKLLLENGANVNDVNNKGETPLMQARSAEIVKLLLENGANVNDVDNKGETALFKVAMTEDHVAVKLLLESLADVNHCTLFGDTALIVAARRMDWTLLRLLLKFGADAKIKNSKGESAVTVACDGLGKEVAEKIVNSGKEMICNILPVSMFM